MSLLNGLTIENEIQGVRDSVGNYIRSSDLYPCTITMAYLLKSKGGALGVHCTFKDATDVEYKQSLWITSGTAKGGKNYFERNGKKTYLPSFSTFQDICLLTVGKQPPNMQTEDKLLKIWNSEQRAEVPTTVPVLMELLGKKVTLGILEITEDVTTKDEATSKYLPTGETKQINDINRVFRSKDNLTSVEIQGKVTEAEFYKLWSDKWKDVVQMKAKGVKKADKGMQSASFGETAKIPPVDSLFTTAPEEEEVISTSESTFSFPQG